MVFRFNQPLQTAVWYFWGSTNTDDDFQRYVDSFALVRRATPVRPAAILYVAPENPMPSATWRRRMAEASTSFATRPLVAFASPSTLVRTIVTGVNWLRPPPYDFHTCATFQEGLAWLDAQRPGVAVVLSDLMDECAREARTPRPP